MYQLVIADINRSRLKDFKKELDLYHACLTPELPKEAVYRKLSSRTYILRVYKRMTPSDICGFLSHSLKLSKEESLISLVVSKDMATQNMNIEWTYNKLIKEMEACKPIFTAKQPKDSSVLYLANYLYMLEKDLDPKHRRDIEAKGAYIITDKLQQYTGKPYTVKKKHTRFMHDEYGRFTYFELNDWIDTTAAILGFKILFYKDDKLQNEIGQKEWIGSEMVFVGNKNWKDKLSFKLDGKTNAMYLGDEDNTWKMIERKEGEELVNDC